MPADANGGGLDRFRPVVTDANALLMTELIGRQPLLAAINVALGMLMSLILLGDVQALVVLGWLTLLLVTQGLRIVFWRWSRRLGADDLTQGAWPRYLVLVSGLSGLVWGALGGLVTVAPSASVVFVVPFALAGMAAGAVAVLSSHRGACVAFLATALGPYAFLLSIGDTAPGGWLAVIVGLYGVGLYAVAVNLRRGQGRLVDLYRRNERLVTALGSARGALEQRVRDRTAALEEANARLADEALRRRQTERLARELGLKDPLTGLPNRTLFLDRLDVATARARRNDTLVGVALIDVDHFKRVNDSLGHLAGDVVLRAVAQRLAETLRASDTVARFGGDEFVAILADLPSSEAALVAAGHLHEAMTTPIQVDVGTVTVSLSIGLALFPAFGATTDELLGGADIALYEAKVRGRARTEMLDARLLEAHRHRRTLRVAWRDRVESGEVDLVCGARHDRDSRRVVGLVVAPAWISADARFDGVDDLKDAARTGGHLVELERLALDRALALLAGAGPAFEVSLSIATETLRSADFASFVGDAVDRHGADPSCLELAVDESDWQRHLEGPALMTIASLAGHGVRFGVDAFGVGSLSLRVLHQAPVSTVRLARGFALSHLDPAGERIVWGAVLAAAETRGLGLALPAAEADSIPAWCSSSVRLLVDDPLKLSPRHALAALGEHPSTPDGQS